MQALAEWIAGRHPVKEALRAGRPIEKLFVQVGVRTGPLVPIIQEAKAAGIVVQPVDRRKLDDMTGRAVHQGVVAVVSARSYWALDDVLAEVKGKQETLFLLAIDHVEDPHNFGSILRTAEAAGVHGVIIPKRRAVGLTATVAKASAGAVEYVPVVRVTNLVRTLRRLKDEGVWVTGADSEAPLLYTDVDFTLPTVLVVGSEGKGISRLVKENCDYLVRLPMKGHVASLNVSVAAGLLMYEVLRKREA